MNVSSLLKLLIWNFTWTSCLQLQKTIISNEYFVIFQLQTFVNELEEHKELATNRLVELERLQEKHQELVMESEQLKMDVSHFIK